MPGERGGARTRSLGAPNEREADAEEAGPSDESPAAMADAVSFDVPNADPVTLAAAMRRALRDLSREEGEETESSDEESEEESEDDDSEGAGEDADAAGAAGGALMEVGGGGGGGSARMGTGGAHGVVDGNAAAPTELARVLAEMTSKGDVNYLKSEKHGLTQKGKRKQRPLKEIRLVCAAKSIPTEADGKAINRGKLVKAIVASLRLKTVKDTSVPDKSAKMNLHRLNQLLW